MENRSAGSLGRHPDRVPETETVARGVERLQLLQTFAFYSNPAARERLIPNTARTAPVAHKTSAHPSRGTMNQAA